MTKFITHKKIFHYFIKNDDHSCRYALMSSFNNDLKTAKYFIYKGGFRYKEEFNYFKLIYKK